MTISASLEREIRQFNKNCEWLKSKRSELLPQPEQWITYEDAFKIIPLSKRWFDVQRNGTTKNGERVEPTLERGTDWKMIGRKPLFNVDSIERLKKELAK